MYAAWKSKVWVNKLPVIALTAALTLSLAAALPLTANAAGSSDYVTVTKNDSYSKDGSFYMCFTLKNLETNYTQAVKAKVFNSAGKEVLSWSGLELAPGATKKFEFMADYRNLPSGTYTFTLYVGSRGGEWKWSYTLNHTALARALSFKSYETYYSENGYYMHKFNVQCTNMKGYKLSASIYDDSGELVERWPESKALARKTNDEVGYFTWSGYANGKKYPSGDYTFVVTGGGKTIEKTYNLKILGITAK
ncbi:MAG: hypothetical protein LBH21_01300 [Gracilibacteraceae bacterium]|jgi:hypothetical protein|nr:hypothetical protein [Gracilibacteraceae bacterium]